jgi:hypothetical protein
LAVTKLNDWRSRKILFEVMDWIVLPITLVHR